MAADRRTPDRDALIDRIYEAAFVPELWPDLLHGLAGAVDGEGATVFVTDLNNVSRWVASPAIHQVLVDWVAGGWVTRNQRTHRMVARRHPGFVTTADVFSPQEIADDDEHRLFLAPRGLGSSAGTFIPMPTGEVVVYSIERRLGAPGSPADMVGFLDGIRPHLARTGALAARLGLDRARTAAETFAALGLAAAALDAQGRVVVANALFGDLVPSMFQDRRDRLRLVSPAADDLLARAVAALALRVDGPVGSIPVAAADGRPPHIVHLLPIRGAARDIFSRPMGLCVAVPVVPGTVPGAEVLQALFDLTPAEARVARAIGEGQDPAALAAAGGLSRETVRTQLRSVFAKTGVRRQTELVALLAGQRIPGRNG